MSQTKLSLAEKILIIPSQGEFGKISNLFLQCSILQQSSFPQRVLFFSQFSLNFSLYARTIEREI
jgi:hypothetical protein